MRDDDIRSTTFQTKTSASSEKINSARVVDEAPQRFQTSAIRFNGRKGENPSHSACKSEVARALQDATNRWDQDAKVKKLRSALLALMVNWEDV